jgi:hypothetical protein
MKIKGRIGEYECRWRRDGYAWAIVEIYADSSCLFGLIKYKECVSMGKSFGRPKRLYVAQEMLPHEMRDWFRHAVDEYERYTEEWSKESIAAND